ncbi:MAG: hypothetical protein KDC98_01240 [Planctomycetes bacterium]|nr:hypothetical protein [Planctomycetota bacterium]
MNSTTALAPTPVSATLPALEAMGAARVEFDQLRSRARRGIWIETLGILGLLCIAYAIPSFLTDRLLRLEVVYRVVLLASFAVVVVRSVRRRLLVPLGIVLDDDEIALAVERRAPGVHEALISSLQFDRSLREAGPSPREHGRSLESRAMMAAVVADTNARLRSIPFGSAIDAARVRRFAWGLVAFLSFFGGWGLVDAGSLGTWAARNLFLGSVDWPRYTTLAFADTDTGIRMPQGDALTIRVAAQGEVPEQVFLSYEFAGGDTGTEPMSSTGDGEFTLTLDAVLEDVVLWAEGGDSLPIEMKVTVVERPRIEDLRLTIGYPAYMERESEVLPATEGDIRLPRGSTMTLEGRSHKAASAAFAMFGEGQKVELALAADGHQFRGEFSPAESGLLVIDVIDTDQLGAGAPPKFLLRVGDDKPPRVDIRLRGIGSLISAHARIPGDLKAKDDFGLRDIDASMRATEGQPAEAPKATDQALPEVPFENVAASYDDPITKNSLRYETATAVDLRQWNTDPDQNSKDNRIRPGMLLSLRFGATDNFGPGEPHHGYSETMTFRVVTRERLQEDLRRRQVEQRNELEKIVEEHQAALLELRETVNPDAAGERESQARARFKALARQQVALGRRTAFIAESYQRILWEYENNRLIESAKVRQMEAVIPAPLHAVAKDAFPVTGRLVDTFSGSADESVREQAVTGYVEIERRLQAVLTEMQQAETLAAILEELRVVIKIEDSVIQEVEDKAGASAADVFGPGSDSKKSDSKKSDGKKNDAKK